MAKSPSVPRPTAERLLALTSRFAKARVAVIGDLLADEFIYGRVERVSREAPCSSCATTRRLWCLAALGMRRTMRRASADVCVSPASRAATNRAPACSRRSTIACARRRSSPGSIWHAREDPNPGWRRAFGQTAGCPDRSITNGRIAGRLRAEFEAKALGATAGADAVLVSDYGFGLVTPAFVDRLRRRLWRSGRPRVPILVDSRYAIHSFHGVTACTPNESEAEQVLGIRIGDDLEVLESAGRAMLRKTKMEALLITRGGRGMALFEPGHRRGTFQSSVPTKSPM